MIDDLLEELMASFTKLAFLVVGLVMIWVLVQAGLILLGTLP